MSEWFKAVRRNFIKATLVKFGQIRRADLMREFDISTAQASNDIAAFMADCQGFSEYCPRTKTYVIIEENSNDKPSQ